MKKRIICFALIACLLFTFVACKRQTLDTPLNVKVSNSGLITWDAVENATGYTVTVNNDKFDVTDTRYQVSDLSKSFTCSVVATAEGFNTSSPSEQATFTPQKNIKVAIDGKSGVHAGGSLTLTATVTGAANTDVTWSIVEGSAYASIENGVVKTEKDISGDKRVIVRATSVEDSKFYGEKVITVNAKTELTADMLEALNVDGKVEYSGYVNVSVYHESVLGGLRLLSTTILPVQTAMDGNVWYAQYDNGVNSHQLYYRNIEGTAYQVQLSFTNEESYSVMMDDTNTPMLWTDSGLYNSLHNLSLSDFTFDSDEWSWKYTGDNDLVDKIAASVNPYEFEPLVDDQGNKHFYLIIDQGEISGIYIKSGADYTIQPGEVTYQQVFVAVNHGDTVEIPAIESYEHNNEFHDDLQRAIDNQKNLTSYKLDFHELLSSPMTSSFNESGYAEIVTSNICYIEPYEVKYEEGRAIHEIVPNRQFGFIKIDDNVYNSFSFDNSNGQYVASRAYNGPFIEARPSFDFVAEIFDTKSVDENDETRVTYYVAEPMSKVATTFYNHVGNDINMYGMFAARGRLNDVTFTPYVTVQNDLIVEAGFYFNMGQLYGVITITYSDFNQADVTEQVKDDVETFTARQVPASWNDVQITVDKSEQLGNIDYEQEGDSNSYLVNALDYMKLYFHDNAIADRLPYFGSALGDSYGFGAIGIYYSPSTRRNHTVLSFYFDVPLEMDYTINSAMGEVGKYLINQGFNRNRYNEYSKNGVNIAVVDNQLDLFIYVWVDTVTE